jgi:antitoxin component HigA of HigAB toxin-antitoxin module
MEAADPVKSINFEMDQGGLTVMDLEPMFGRSDRGYELRNRNASSVLARLRSAVWI